jgi:hypothetical protein
MRQTISGLVAAIAVVAASAAPAMACGGGFFQSTCSPCGPSFVSPCAQAFVPAPVFSGCNSGCGGWVAERLPDPVRQYYYADQGPTYDGPGDFAPYLVYRESALPVWGAYRHHPHYYGYGGVRYGYGPRHGYVSHYSLPPRQFYAHHNMRYGYPTGEPHRYGQREHTHRYD